MNLIDIYIFFIGLSIGSFLNVCIYRIPKKESIVWKPSYCPQCNHRIYYRYNIPVISYLMLKGKCEFCKAKIALQYPLVELITAFLFMFLYWRFGLSQIFFKYTILVSILITVSFIDIKYKIIPNSIIIFGLVTGLAINLFFYRLSINDYLIGGLLGEILLWLSSLLGYLLFRKQGMGGGDIKLAVVIGLFIGWKGIVLAFYLAVVLGAFFGLLGILSGKLKRFNKIAFGPYLAIGALAYIFGG